VLNSAVLKPPPSFYWLRSAPIGRPSRHDWFSSARAGLTSAKSPELGYEDLGRLGLKLDCGGNARCEPDADVASLTFSGRILVISTREDLTIVRESRSLILSETEGRREYPRRQARTTIEKV
jgi:hypothetical protein